MSVIHWVVRCKGGKESRSGALMRFLGCLEMDPGWCFRAKHIAGMNNTLADGISRWQRASINASLREFGPDIDWQERKLGFAGDAICSGVLASSTSTAQLRSRLSILTRQVSHLGPQFRRLIGRDQYLKSDAAAEDNELALVDFAAWCSASQGNQAGTIASKVSAVQYFHRL